MYIFSIGSICLGIFSIDFGKAIFISCVSKFSGQVVAMGLPVQKEGGGGFCQTKIPKTKVLRREIFLRQKVSFFLTQEFIQMSLEKTTGRIEKKSS